MIDMHEGILEIFVEAGSLGTNYDTPFAWGITIKLDEHVRGMTERRVRTAWRERHKTPEWRAYNTQWQREHAEERNRRKRERCAAARAARSAA